VAGRELDKSAFFVHLFYNGMLSMTGKHGFSAFCSFPSKFLPVGWESFCGC
jgi:hypothetical protein